MDFLLSVDFSKSTLSKNSFRNTIAWITFANSLDPDQNQQNVSGSKLFDTLIVFLFFF